MIVAVTGANGFIGRHVCDRFAADGWVVRPIVRRDIENGRLGELIEGSDVVVHVAGATRAPSRRMLHESNVELTRRVVQTARAARARRLVFISSQAAAGPASSSDAPVSEDASPQPIEEYGRSKLGAELVVRDASANLEHVIIRPASVYGPGDRDFLAMFRLARRGLALHAGNRRQLISIVHVRDAVEAIARAATTGPANRTFFVANDEPVTWSSLFGMAAECAGRTIVAEVNLPRPIVTVGAAFGDMIAKVRGRAGLLTTEKAALAKPPYWICSNARAKQELGFSSRIGLGAGLRETYEWYVSEGWL
jgi:nucleoside-diphosphate-sugar epimerase